ncbi:hypothetical protein [Luteitalea sp. TBR-22]|uniref:hypothetical protein n=1 Tax=Luteitalea sp. TBR-22 TaxID=2802971 RepID=UPI001AF5D9AE|nr:hypothetical protein [Luteitalea sp. TBR-22]
MDAGLQAGQHNAALDALTDAPALLARLSAMTDQEAIKPLRAEWRAWLAASSDADLGPVLVQRWRRLWAAVATEWPADARRMLFRLGANVVVPATMTSGTLSRRASELLAALAPIADLVETDHAASVDERGAVIHVHVLLGEYTADHHPGREVAHYERALAIAEREAARAPEVERYREWLVNVSSRLAHAVKPHDAARARVLYTRAHELASALAASAPGDLRRRHSLAVTLEDLGRLDVRTDPARALALHVESVRLQESIVAEAPESARYRVSLLQTCAWLSLHERLEHGTDATGWWQKALDQARALQELPGAESEPAVKAAIVLALYAASRANQESAPQRTAGWLFEALPLVEGLLGSQPGHPEWEERSRSVCDSLCTLAINDEGDRLGLRSALLAAAPQIEQILDRPSRSDRDEAGDRLRKSYGILAAFDRDEAPERATAWRGRLRQLTGSSATRTGVAVGVH